LKLFQNLSVKQKQRAKIFMIIGGVLLIVFLVSMFTEKKEDTKKREEIRQKKKFSLLSEKVEKDLWIAAEGQNIKTLQKSVEEMTTEIDRFRKELEEVKKKASTPTIVKDPKQTANPPVPPPLPLGDKKAGEKVLPTKEEFKKDLEKSKEKEKDKEKEKPAPAIRVFGEQKTDKTTKKETTASKKEDYLWIPTGSITKAVLLSGIDVPTSHKTKSEPYPVLMMLSDYSILPNDFRMNLKQCFIIGAGYGSIVEERAYIRTETLSCIKRDGTPWEVAMKGQIVGEDGKLGMRGKVISKQGREIALAITTGVLSGLANAFKPQQAVSYFRVEKDDDTVKTLTPTVGDVAIGAGLSGVSNALSRVADFYLKLAEQMYPVIEIEAGREIEIVIVKGGKLSPQEKQKEETVTKKEPDSPKRETTTTPPTIRR